MNKGFTLVEVLAVLTIMGILLLITIPTIDSVLVKQRKKLYNDQLIEVEEALKLWGDVNADKLPTALDPTITVTLEELKNAGFIEDNFTNPITDKCYDNGSEFEIKLINGVYSYKVDKIIDGTSSDCILD